MKTVKEILDAKGHDVSTIGPKETVLDALKLMEEKDVGALVVMEEGMLKGLITERDYARKVILKGRASPETAVREVMSKKVVCTVFKRTADEVMAVMTDKRVRHLPVIDQKQVVGLVSIGDLVKAIISDQQQEIEQLEQYISG